MVCCFSAVLVMDQKEVKDVFSHQSFPYGLTLLTRVFSIENETSHEEVFTALTGWGAMITPYIFLVDSTISYGKAIFLLT